MVMTIVLLTRRSALFLQIRISSRVMELMAFEIGLSTSFVVVVSLEKALPRHMKKSTKFRKHQPMSMLYDMYVRCGGIQYNNSVLCGLIVNPKTVESLEVYSVSRQSILIDCLPSKANMSPECLLAGILPGTPFCL